MRRLLIIQSLLIVVVIAFAWSLFGERSLIAAIYGGGVALANTLWLGRRVTHVGELADQDLKRGVYSIYFNAVQRFVFVLVALGIGLQALKLMAEPLLISFGVAQFAYFFAERPKS